VRGWNQRPRRLRRPGHVEEGAGLAQLVVEHHAQEAQGDDEVALRGELHLDLVRIVRLVREVDHRVRDVATRGVDLLRDVQALGPQEGGDLTQRAGLVAVHYAQPRAST